MAKSKKTIKEVTEAVVAAITPSTQRETRWAEFLERYKAQNPDKYAARLKAGELKMPSDFQ